MVERRASDAASDDGHRDRRGRGPHHRLADPGQGARRRSSRPAPTTRCVDVDDRPHQRRPEPRPSSRSRADDEAALDALLVELQVARRQPASSGDAELVAADVDGVLPAGFYSTTNLPTSVRVDDHWLDVENPEMDCARRRCARRGRARTAPMHRVRSGRPRRRRPRRRAGHRARAAPRCHTRSSS